MILNNDQKASLALVRAGLWEKEVLLASYGKFDLKEIYRLAQEQAVLGLVASGLVHVTDVKFPKEEVLQFVGRTLQIEQQNKAMYAFIADLIKKLRKEVIYAILVKGQGIAQC